MSLEGTDRFQSPYEQMKRDRDVINNCLFPGPKNSPEKYIYCPICHRNYVKESEDGNTLIYPTCGNKHVAERKAIYDKNVKAAKTIEYYPEDELRTIREEMQKKVDEELG